MNEQKRHNTRVYLGQEKIFIALAMETVAKQIATTCSIPILDSLASAPGASVAKAEGTEYQPTTPWSGLFAVSNSTNEASAVGTTPATRNKE